MKCAKAGETCNAAARKTHLKGVLLKYKTNESAAMRCAQTKKLALGKPVLVTGTPYEVPTTQILRPDLLPSGIYGVY